MSELQKSRHYLAQHYQPLSRMNLDFCRTNLLVRAVYCSGLKNVSTMQVRIVKLSTGGALLHGYLLHYLPEQFYLCLGEREIFITCAKRHLQDEKMAVVFAQPESAAFVQALARIRQPLSTLKTLRGASAPVIESRVTARHAT